MTDNDPGDLANYTWQVSDDITFATTVASGTTQSTQTAVTLTPGTYYWRVNASDGWEDIIYTPPWQFTIASADANPTVENVTVAGYLQGAAELQHIIDRTPDFGWEFHDVNPSDTQARYHVVLNYDSNDTLVWEQNQTGTAQSITYPGTPALINGETYYIWVAVQDSSTSALWSQWSSQLVFRINTPPLAPTLASPADGATPSPGDITLTWNSVAADPEGDTLTYEYCVDITNPPTACGVHTGTTTSTSAPAFTAADGTQYFWQVRVSDGYEDSPWSGVWSFTPSSIPPNTPPTITITSQPTTLEGQSTYTITWTMSDTETSSSLLIVYLNYTYSGVSYPITMLVGQTSHVWTIPDIDATNVVIHATVIDAGMLTDTDQTSPFSINKKEIVEGDMTVWLILIVIIIVVVILVLVLLMRRKKPKEEEAPAEGEIGEMEEEELIEEAAPAAAPAKAAAKAPGKTLECPSCGTVVASTDKECFMCGAKL